jgi:hypothetical protein
MGNSGGTVMNDLQVYDPAQPPQVPHLPARLRRQVAKILAGPTRYPGVADDDPGFLMASQAPVYYDPDAERMAAERRAVLEQPANRAMIRDWLEMLAGAVSNPPATEREFNLRLAAVAMACSDLPAVCWGEVTMRAALIAWKFWPAVQEIHEAVKAHADLLQRELAALDAIAKGERFTTGYREPPEPYDPGPASPAHDAHWSSPRPGRANDFDDMTGKSTSNAVPPLRTVEQQRAEFDIPETDLLAARRAKFAPATDGGPTLRLVK